MSYIQLGPPRKRPRRLMCMLPLDAWPQRTVRVMGALCFLTEFVYWCFCFATPMSITNAALPDVAGAAAYTGTASSFFASLPGAAL